MDFSELEGLDETSPPPDADQALTNATLFRSQFCRPKIHLDSVTI